MDKQSNLEQPKLQLYQLTKNIAAKIGPRISFALRVLGMIFDKSISSRSPILAVGKCFGTADLFDGTQN